jgi:hypothetical protein
MLSERRYIGGKIGCFRARQVHIWHFWMRIEQEKGNLGRIKVRHFCNSREGPKYREPISGHLKREW